VLRPLELLPAPKCGQELPDGLFLWQKQTSGVEPPRAFPRELRVDTNGTYQEALLLYDVEYWEIN
jgi:hypothetical protein